MANAISQLEKKYVFIFLVPKDNKFSLNLRWQTLKTKKIIKFKKNIKLDKPSEAVKIPWVNKTIKHTYLKKKFIN